MKCLTKLLKAKNTKEKERMLSICISLVNTNNGRSYTFKLLQTRWLSLSLNMGEKTNTKLIMVHAKM